MTMPLITLDTSASAAPVVIAVDNTLVIDLTPCCPWCFEDAGSRWCNCDLIAETLRTEANQREPQP
jgi:hypothetical protein